MASGTVKWFNDAMGFDFIAADDGSKDVFAYYSDIASSGFKSLEERSESDIRRDRWTQGQAGFEHPGRIAFTERRL